MYDPIGKLVQRPHMIQVGMRGDGGERPAEHIRRCTTETRKAHARINDKVAVPTLDVPDIAPHDPDDMRLPNARDAITKTLGLEPVICYLKCHHGIVSEIGTVGEPALSNIGALNLKGSVLGRAGAHADGAGSGPNSYNTLFS